MKAIQYQFTFIPFVTVMVQKNCQFLTGIAFVFSVFFYSAGIFAQARVVEAGGGVVPVQAQSQTAQTTQASSGGANSSDDIVVNLYFQLERLQEEMQTLRGIVEEQSYQMRRMQTEQRDRYLDIDRRLSGDLTLSSEVPTPAIPTDLANTVRNQPAPFNQTNRPSPAVSNNASSASTVTPTPVPTGPMTEQDLYRTALNFLLEESRYDESITLFQQYVDAYPAGRFFTNALYWQGEALILSEDYGRAREVFTQVIDNYGTDPKAPGALLKLGVVYNQMGNTNQAIQAWQRIGADYPNSLTEIRAADDYLRRSGN